MHWWVRTKKNSVHCGRKHAQNCLTKFMRDMSFFINSTGTGEPAAIPVLYHYMSHEGHVELSRFYRKCWKSNVTPLTCSLRSHSARTPRKCVGTPWSAVHFSSSIASTIAAGSYIGEGYTIDEPCVQAARLPSTRPKQWNKGGGLPEWVSTLEWLIKRSWRIRANRWCLWESGAYSDRSKERCLRGCDELAVCPNQCDNGVTWVFWRTAAAYEYLHYSQNVKRKCGARLRITSPAQNHQDQSKTVGERSNLLYHWDCHRRFA